MRGLSVLIVLLAALAVVAVPTDAKLVKPVIDASLLSADSTATVDAEALSQVKSFAEHVQAQQATVTCPAEALRRVSLCQKILRNYVTVSDVRGEKPYVPFVPTWSSSAICKALNIRFPSTVNYDDCQSVAGHMFGAAGSNAMKFVSLSRENDIHDVCVHLLSTEFPAASGQRFLNAADAPACGLKATGGVTGVRCLLLHGMGVDRVMYRDVANGSNYPRPYDGWLGRMGFYWNVEIPFDGVCDARFYMSDTDKRGWNDPALQKEFCNAVAKFEPHFVFTHSMGNMIMAAAIHDRIAGCDRVSKTAGAGKTLWFSSQAPWTGSPVATSFHNTCATPAKGLLNKIKSAAIKAYQPCGSEPAAESLYPQFVNKYSSMQINLMKAVASSYVSGALCGLSGGADGASRAFNVANAGLWFLSHMGTATTIVDWGVDSKFSYSAPYSGNDGLVNWQSCNLGFKYEPTPSGAFYAAKVNHADGPCSHPDDASHGSQQQPCTWYVNRAFQARTAFGLGTARSANVLKISRTEYVPFGNFHYARSFLELEDYHTLEERNALDKAAEEKAAAELAAKNSPKAIAKQQRKMSLEAAVATEVISHLEAHALVNESVEEQAEIDAQAEAQLESEGLLDAEVDAEFEADAEAEADVEMELAHQQHLDAESKDKVEELEIQLEAAVSEE